MQQLGRGRLLEDDGEAALGPHREIDILALLEVSHRFCAVLRRSVESRLPAVRVVHIVCVDVDGVIALLVSRALKVGVTVRTKAVARIVLCKPEALVEARRAPLVCAAHCADADDLGDERPNALPKPLGEAKVGGDEPKIAAILRLIVGAAVADRLGRGIDAPAFAVRKEPLRNDEAAVCIVRAKVVRPQRGWRWLIVEDLGPVGFGRDLVVVLGGAELLLLLRKLGGGLLLLLLLLKLGVLLLKLLKSSACC